MIDRASLVGSKWLKALNGTGCDTVALAVLLPPPPPLALLLLPVELDREVPAVDVFALEEVLVEVLALVSAVALLALLAEPDNAELEFTVVAADPVLVFEEDSAEVDPATEDTPLVADEVRSDVVDPPPPAPAPEDDPWVLDAVAATVPVVVACT